jgi:hypothetical protein
VTEWLDILLPFPISLDLPLPLLLWVAGASPASSSAAAALEVGDRAALRAVARVLRRVEGGEACLADVSDLQRDQGSALAVVALFVAHF